jgi:CheY-like chemotaxis protein
MMADEQTVECPQCGHTNEPVEERCANCGLELKWALERGSQYWIEEAATRPPLILVSDDEPAMLMLYGLIFEREGYRVAGSSNAVVAIELAERFHPDLIITDFMKPDMNGAEMLSRLRSNPALRDIPAMMVSAGYHYQRICAVMEAGATCCLHKPFSPSDLTAVVASVLAGDLLPLVLFVRDKTTRKLPISLVENYRILAPYPREETPRGAKLLKPDVIAISVQLSDESGLDILAGLKADDATRNIPVVMLAAGSPLLARLLIRLRARALGAHTVYSGPLNSERLHDVFQAALGE